MNCSWNLIISLDEKLQTPGAMVQVKKATMQKIIQDLRALKNLEEHDAKLSPELKTALEQLILNWKIAGSAARRTQHLTPDLPRGEHII